MELNARMLCILQEVVEAEGPVTVEYICRRNAISRRTFYYDLKGVNAWLQSQKMGQIQLENGRCQVSRETAQVLEDIIRDNHVGYFMSVEERKIMMALYIGLAEEKMRIQQFCQLFDISKNTVLSDIRQIREEVATRQIQLESDGSRGYRFTGNEYAIRNYLYRQFKKSRSVRTSQYIRDFVNAQMGHNNGKAPGEVDYWQCLRECLMIYEDKVHTSIVEADTEGCVFVLAVAYLRYVHHQDFHINLTKGQELAETNVYQGVVYLFEKLQEYISLQVSQEELYYVTLNFLAMQNFDLSQEGSCSPRMMAFTQQFLDNLQNTGRVVFRNPQELLARLANHMAPLLYRVEYGIQVENPLLDEVKTAYQEAFSLVRTGMEITSPYIAAKITEEELAYLAIYIADGVRPEKKEKTPSSNRILVVCAEGVATALLVRDQLENLFGSTYVYELSSIKNIQEKRLEDYVLVVSTIRSPLLEDRAVHVSMFVTEENKRMILDRLNKEQVHMKGTLQEIMDLIQKYTGPEAAYLPALNIDLLNIFHEKTGETPREENQA